MTRYVFGYTGSMERFFGDLGKKFWRSSAGGGMAINRTARRQANSRNPFQRGDRLTMAQSSKNASTRHIIPQHDPSLERLVF